MKSTSQTTPGPRVKSKLTLLTERLSANPELVEELFNEAEEAIPDYLGIINQIRQSQDRFRIAAEVDAYIAGLRAEW